ncbi:gelsolin-related protein of 125 kDa-like isoform X2 [Alosa alosa]|uniref:gelsolin-related protein of 125 kDa-like isoform X2 n=1 Tax=Alosa alosa TaxID=278164 RepID=UPI0020150562|nr:gelsolin-related protein of 125 kDa-like isoform X2 [Alosa alosa]
MDVGLPFRSSCAETHQVDLNVIVKEEDIKDDVKQEESGHLIACPDAEEKSTYSATLQTTVKKEEEEEEVRQLGPLSVMVKEEDIKEEEYGHMISCPDEEEKPFAELHCESQTDCKTETDVTESPRSTYNEMTTVTIEVKKEEQVEEEEHEQLESASQYPHETQQKIHGQNDELNLQLKGSLYHCPLCRKSFTVVTELEKCLQTHSVSVNEQQNTGGKNIHISGHCVERAEFDSERTGI